MNRSASRLRPILAWALTGAVATVCATALGQSSRQPPQTVQWHVAVGSSGTLQPGQRSTLELTGQILQGFTVDDNAIVQPAGAATGSATTRRVDPGFGFEIQYYSDSLQLHLPIQVKRQAATGKQQVPVAVRFQSCSEQTCLPPATVHLLVDVDVQPRA